MLGLNLAVMASEPRDKVSADCFNDPFVPDEVAPLEKSFHDFLDITSMQELNVSAYIENKNREDSNKIKLAFAHSSGIMTQPSVYEQGKPIFKVGSSLLMRRQRMSAVSVKGQMP